MFYPLYIYLLVFFLIYITPPTNTTNIILNTDIKANIIDIYQMPDDYIIFFPGLISVSYATIGKIKKNSIINIFECDIYCTKHSDNFIDDMLVSSKINKVNNLFFIERYFI